MIPTLQKITIIVLALLQFAAPLVHAHSGMEISGLGVHVPGLESWSIGTEVETISSNSGQYPVKNCLVSVGSAIQQKAPVSVEPSVDYALIQPVGVFSVALDACLINFSPYPNQFIPFPCLSWHGTRAPPVV